MILPKYIFILQNIGCVCMKCVAYLQISSYGEETWAGTNTWKHSLGKTTKYNFAFCAVADAGEKRTFDSVSNWIKSLKYFIQAVACQYPTQKLLWPPNFLAFSCGP